MNKLPFKETLSEAIQIGFKNILSLIAATLLYIVTIWIPYINIGTTLAMNALPAELAKGLDRTALERIIKRKGSEEVIIKIPKFETSFTIELNDMLKSLGMVDAFNPTKADFSSMSSHLSLYISRVLQKARIKVEEKGTEAAAVTVIDMKLTSAIPSPGEPLTFYATRPFLYTISEVSTGAILFMGQYNGD